MVLDWHKKEMYIRKVLSKKFNTNLEEKNVLLEGINGKYRFDLVSSDGEIVGEIKSYKYELPSGGRPSAKIAHASEACLFLMHAKNAKRRLLVFSEKEFYEHYRKERQGQLAEHNGIEIILVEC